MSIALGKVGQGKLWQSIEMASMIGAGTTLFKLSGFNGFTSLSFFTVTFFAGKATYGVTRALLQRVSLFSTTTDRRIAWAVAIPVGAYAMKKCSDSNGGSLSNLHCLRLTAVSSLLGACIRELVYRGLMKTVVVKA